ncbi:MAG: hypothetical protein EOP19_11830 [Hyphomicrobiales bacterium]|nr:MAG: hypothetical protein EOP19_11830 [Hyphomicrobiales bacterium]
MTTYETVSIGISILAVVISSYSIMSAFAAKRSAIAAETQAKHAGTQAVSAARSAEAAETQAAAASDALAHLKEANEISALTFWQSQLDASERALVSIQAVAEAFADVKLTRAMLSTGQYPHINAADALMTKGTCNLAVANTSPDQIAIRGTALLSAIRDAFAPLKSREVSPSVFVDAEMALSNIFARIDDLDATIPGILARRGVEMERAQTEIARLEVARAKTSVG